jgi:phage FluMu gp28-like protein
VSLTSQEKQAALELVEEMQAARATRNLRPEEGPKVLLPYQSRWHSDASPVRLCEKGRRIGFSWGALAAEAALAAASQERAGGMDQFYMGYNMAMAAEFIGDCAFFARAYKLACSAIDVGITTDIIDDERRDIVTYKIRFASGFKIEALSSAPHNWRSRQGHARIDEAAFHQDLAEVVKGALAFRMWGGRIDIVSTHNGEDNQFMAYIKEIMAGKLPWSLHKVTFSDALREGFYRRVCLVKGLPWGQDTEEAYRESIYADYPTPEDSAEELDCVPKRGSGAYFSRMLMESCMEDGISTVLFKKPAEFVLDSNRLQVTLGWFNDHVKPLVDNMPTGQRTAYGQDFGRTADMSVIWIMQEERPGKWRMAFAVEMRRIPHDCQELITDLILDDVPLFHHATFDATGNGQSHAERAMQKHGGPAYITCVQLTAKYYAEWFPKYRRAYEDKSLTVARSEDTIADHRVVVLQKGQPTMSAVRVKGTDGEMRHGDSAIAGLLCFVAASTDGVPPAGVSVNNENQRARGHRPRMFGRAGRLHA